MPDCPHKSVWPVLMLVCCLLAGVAVGADKNLNLERARAAMAKLEDDPLVRELAPREFSDARVAMKDTEIALARGSREARIDQLAYIAEKRIEIAKAVAQRRELESEVEMLSAERDGNLFAVGGHYASDPRDLSVESFDRLHGPDTQNPFIGMRVARFLTVDDDGKANGRVEARIEALAESGKPYVINTWAQLRVNAAAAAASHAQRRRGLSGAAGPPASTAGMAAAATVNRLRP